MKRILLFSITFTLLCTNAFGIRIGQTEFSSDSIIIDFEDVEENDPNSGNGALTPILDYLSLGVVFHVHNQEDFVGTIHDVFRLGGFAGQGLSIATNVGDDASIELSFVEPVFQVGALIAVSNANMKVYDCEDNLIEEGETENVFYHNDPMLRITEFIGIESQGICKAVFTDISPNGLILSLDNVIFTLGSVVSIESILTFFDESVANGTLEGDGPGNSANGRLNALRNMLEMAGDLIEIPDIEGACVQLKAAMEKCDDDPLQPDFVTGEAAEDLYDMIVDLMAELGCE